MKHKPQVTNHKAAEMSQSEFYTREVMCILNLYNNLAQIITVSHKHDLSYMAATSKVAKLIFFCLSIRKCHAKIIFLNHHRRIGFFFLTEVLEMVGLKKIGAVSITHACVCTWTKGCVNRTGLDNTCLSITRLSKHIST